MPKFAELIDDLITVFARIKRRPVATSIILLALALAAACLIWLQSYLSEHAKIVAVGDGETTEVSVENPLLIDKIIVHSKGRGTFEVDFRVRNVGQAEVLINGISLEYLGMSGSDSLLNYSQPPIGPLDISDLKYKQQVKHHIAEVVRPGKVARFAVVLTSGWTNWGKFLMFKPFLNTSVGDVAHSGIKIHMAPVSDNEKMMMDAVKTGNLQQVRRLLDVDPDLHTIEPLIERFGFVDVLYQAAGDEHFEIVKLLLGRLPRPLDRKRTVGALHVAVERGNVQIARLLIENGVDVNAVQEIDPACWREAADDVMSNKYPDNGRTKTRVISNMHMNCGAPTKKGGVMLLHKAAYYGHQEIVSLLIACGADRAAFDANGETPLDYAKLRNNDELVQILTPNGT